MDSVLNIVENINYLTEMILVPFALTIGFIASAAYIRSQERQWFVTLIGCAGGIITLVFIGLTEANVDFPTCLLTFPIGAEVGIGYVACVMAGRGQRIAARAGWLFGLVWAVATVCDQTHPVLSPDTPDVSTIFVISTFLTTWILSGLILALFAKAVLSIANAARRIGIKSERKSR